MNSKVYFIPIKSYKDTEEISSSAKKLLEKLINENKIKLEKNIAIKVHFGEKNNITFIEPKNYLGIINYLKEKKCDPKYIETNVLYKGERTFSNTHLKLAKKHGFTQLPILIADGDHGEKYEEIKINQKHFKKCKIGSEFVKRKQLIVLTHFKGHILAGFGGAIKQLSMGFASRGGKLAMHAQSKPIINPIACKKCNTCVAHCPTDACVITKIPHIDYKKCIGCANCIAVCPHDAVKINWASTLPKQFYEKLSEYALAATLDEKGNKKEFLYINFAFNITKHCDCDGSKMDPIAKDIGILASTDPVALDKASLDLIRKNENKKIFKGDHTLEYAQKIGLGNMEYELITLE